MPRVKGSPYIKKKKFYIIFIWFFIFVMWVWLVQLEDLEKKLNEEIKSRNKAEKRLRHALKKLESLKILDLPDSSVGSFSSYSSLANEGFDDKRSNSVKTDNDSLQCSSFEEVKEEKNGLVGSENESWCSIGSELSHVKDEYCGNQLTENCGSEEEFHVEMRYYFPVPIKLD